MIKYKVIFSVDYEIHGNGDGSPMKLMVEPTNRMLKYFEKYGAKVTIFADIAEIIRFKEYYDTFGQDKFFYIQIKDQLQDAIIRGHDVQLHIHSGYFGSVFNGERWLQNWDEYNLTSLPYEIIFERIKTCKLFLEKMLKEVKYDYKCNVFRAANWSMSPTPNIYKALIENDIFIDSSVFKYGVRNSNVHFDYSNAYSNILPWPANMNNICTLDLQGKLWEVPIYSEQKYMISLFTPIRLFRYIRSKFHKHERVIKGKKHHQKQEIDNAKLFAKVLQSLREKHAWKLDFNQATSGQLIKAFKKISSSESVKNYSELPVVLIGHSKTFIKVNEKLLYPFLKYISKRKDVHFSTYNDLELTLPE